MEFIFFLTFYAHLDFFLYPNLEIQQNKLEIESSLLRHQYLVSITIHIHDRLLSISPLPDIVNAIPQVHLCYT